MKIPSGLHAHRLKPEAGNEREVALAAQWEKEHANNDLLGMLFEVPCSDDDPQRQRGFRLGFGPVKVPLGEPTERDRIVAATIFQWLGSNVGLWALTQALNAAGYDVRAKQ